MRKTLIATLVTCTALLSGCQYGEAKEALKSLLNDPDSVKFGELKPGKQKGDVCGYFNAKNRMGGYVGETAFLYNNLTGSAMIVVPPTDNDYRSLARFSRTGGSLFNESLSEVSAKCYAVEKWIEQCNEPPPSPKHDMCDKAPNDFVTELRTRYQ